MSSPFHWQPPPLPEAFALPQTAKFRAEPTKIWHRKLWSGEASLAPYNLMLPSYADIILSCHVKVLHGRSLTVEAVREAMRLLRFEHPVIACRIAYREPDTSQPMSGPEARLVYAVPASEAEINDWLHETVIDETDALVEAGGDVANAVARVRREIGKAQNAYIPNQLNLHCIPASVGKEGALVLRVSHVLFDALGAFEFLNKIAGKISSVLHAEWSRNELVWGEEVKRLVQPAVEYTRVPWAPEEPGQNEIMPKKLFDAMVHQSRATVPSLYTPFPQAPSTYTATLHRSIPEKGLVGLVNTARAHGCTLFPIASAASAFAALSVSPPDPQHLDDLAAFQLVAPISLRRKGILTRDDGLPSAIAFCPLVSKDLGRFLRSFPDHKASKEDIWILAREINNQLKELSRELPTVALWAEQMRATLTRPVPDAPSPAEAKPPAVPVPVISSFGVVDSYLAPRHGTPGVNEIELSEPRMTTRNCYTPAASSMVHVFTWNKTLHVSVSYPEALLGTPEEQAEALKQGDAERSGSLLAWTDKYVDILKEISHTVE